MASRRRDRVPDFSHKDALLLDMNATFMFGHDRFDETQNYSRHYHEIGGSLEPDIVNQLITGTYAYLDARYPSEKYRDNFPSLREALLANGASDYSAAELDRLESTFAFHEMGSIPAAYAAVIHDLANNFRLGAVIDIWARKDCWLEEFARAGIDTAFDTLVFSSDNGIVKPSPIPFASAMEALAAVPETTLMIGDSVDRDLAGANNAGIDCIIVGEETSAVAVAHYPSLLEFAADIRVSRPASDEPENLLSPHRS